MKNLRNHVMVAVLALLSVSAVLGQEAGKDQINGSIELGVRNTWGDVYGRPDLPFTPNLSTSKFNEYRDVRNGFFIPKFNLDMPDVLETRNYLTVESQKAIYKDQSYLASFGQYGKFLIQFRYDEIPHIYTNTARTAMLQTAPGVWIAPATLRNTLQPIAGTTALPGTIQTQIVPGMSFVTPQIIRRSGTVLLSYNFTPEWNLNFSFKREHESGARPIGLIFNSSPSAATSGGYGLELPEPINYFTNTVKFGTEYEQKNWGFQAGYLGSFFENNINTLTFDNPFRATDCVQPTGCTAATQGPAKGLMDLYPNNHAHYLNFAGTVGLGKFFRVMASVNPGWLRQNDLLLPYSSNTLLLAQTGALPVLSLNGEKQTLAANVSLVSKPVKAVQFKAAYRQYDYNNNTASHDFTGIQGDIAAADLLNPVENTPFGYNKKNLDLTGTWVFKKRNSVKVGYEGEWFDRKHRDVESSIEHGFVSAVDLEPTKDLLFRASYRHSNRTPDAYQDEEALVISGGIPSEHPSHRRFDEAPRTRDRGDVLLQYSPLAMVTVSAFAGTLQDDYNKAGGVNSTTPLNFLAASAASHPYYLFGVVKDINYTYGFDATVAFSREVSVFGEYSREKNNKRMVSRYRVPGGATPLPMDCGTSGRACDSGNNDWESAAIDNVDVFAGGLDLFLGKKVYITTYYSLSAGTGDVNSHPLGDPTITTGVNKFMLTGTNSATDYPQTVSRQHELAAVLKFKLTKNLTPKFEYRYQRFDNKDYQTSAMTPYMGCVSGLPPAAPIPGCGNVLLGTPSNFYPYNIVGDPSAARYLFLGTDQPSYSANTFSATLQYTF
jgi:MtrB/PioB family decaheme-associated outer membrane protein